MTPQVPNYIGSAAELRADMAEVFAVYRSGAFGQIAPARYALRDAARLHAQVERRAVAGLSVLVP